MLAALAGAAPAHADTASRLVTFVDDHNGRGLTIELSPQAPDLGSFAFYAPGRGLYVGAFGAAMQQRGSRVIINFNGPATLEQPANLTDPSLSSSQVTPVNVRVRASLSPDRHAGQAILNEASVGPDDHERLDLNANHNDDEQEDEDDGSPLRFHLVARQHHIPNQQVLQAFEQATLAADFRRLYGLMNSEVTTAYTVDSFVAAGAQQVAAGGRVTELRRLSVLPVQTADSGLTFFAAEYSARVQPSSGGSLTQHYVAYFVDQGGAWKLWFTDNLP